MRASSSSIDTIGRVIQLCQTTLAENLYIKPFRQDWIITACYVELLYIPFVINGHTATRGTMMQNRMIEGRRGAQCFANAASLPDVGPFGQPKVQVL